MDLTNTGIALFQVSHVRYPLKTTFYKWLQLLPNLRLRNCLHHFL
jgi:hypothetical protein